MDLSTVDDLEFFEEISRSKSLTEAARSWGKSLPSVSKRLTQLESRLGAQLVRRSTRKLTLTPEGEQYAAGALAILQQKMDLEEGISQKYGELRGRIAVHTTVGLGRIHIAPLLGEFVRDHPGVSVDLQLSALPLNIAGSSFDLGIRVGSLEDSQLKFTRLAESRRVVCASPQYLERMGAPSTTAELEQHNCIILRQDNSDYALWRFGEQGRERNVRVNGNMVSDDGEVVAGWCLQGLGLMMRSTWHVNPMLQQGLLTQVLQDVPTPAADIHAVYPDAVHTPRRVTAAIDYLRRGLAERLA
ncbi:LysR family transcriptional regulator [Arthrobacter sp. CDRTa11]|uniref:LysR family transcriptional regulator n=1 Tax=Arthrobacter sp. CDRTa11 TaxID=2651199 RepID=UPI002265F233|nr:LysR family transcriptional regulator [Arthrobacter sp. CDRTa11]UZX01583.1 LysR family transcriptional regulator [Arthrobacter sp. CDRTa11]